MPRWGIAGEAVSKTRMAHELNAVEQAIARALRDNLERLKHTSDELHHVVNDVVSACSSNKPTNALPPLLRAQTSAASLSAALEELSRFIAVTLQTGARSPLEAEISRLVTAAAVEAPPAAPEPMQPIPVPLQPMAQPLTAVPPAEHQPAFTPPPPPVHEHIPEPVQEPEPEGTPDFDVNRLTPEEQELHRRANRVAKV